MQTVNNSKVDKETLARMVKFLVSYGVEGQRIGTDVDPMDFYPLSMYYTLSYNYADEHYYYKLSPFALQILNDV